MALPVTSAEPEATGRRRERAALPSLSTRSSFTLIELLVVVAVISILAAILLPVLSKAREKAKVVVCMNNIRQIGLATLNYASENDDFLPRGSWAADPTDDDYYRMTFYYKSRGMLWYDYGAKGWQNWFCPSALSRGKGFDEGMHGSVMSDYFMSGDRGDSMLGANNPSLTPYGYLGSNRNSIGSPANVSAPTKRLGIYSDASERLIWMDAMNSDGITDRARGGISDNWYVPVNSHAYGGTHYIPRGGNYFMADGHGEWRDFLVGYNVYSRKGQSWSYRR